MTGHGRLYLRDRVPPRSIHFDRGRFGRLFPWLPPFAPDSSLLRERLMELGRPGGLLDARDPPPPASPLTPNPRNRDNPDQTAGVTFLGQFVDHDVTCQVPGYIANFAGDEGRPFLAHLFRADADHSLADPDDLIGGKRAPRRFVDWRTFFDLGPTPPGHEDLGASPKPNKRIDSKLSSILFDLPGVAGGPRSLAQRNLLRGLTFELPSGQRVARAMGLSRLKREELADLLPLGFDEDTPLWLYILREAEVLAEGTRLGPVGGRIVAEVLLGLLEGDDRSYLRQDPGWQPTFGRDRHFTMTDLLRLAKVG
jgi:hypothetical protein